MAGTNARLKLLKARPREAGLITSTMPPMAARPTRRGPTLRARRPNACNTCGHLTLREPADSIGSGEQPRSAAWTEARCRRASHPAGRSEERRGGKECRERGLAYAE